jgi:hypothetical protein
MMWQPSIDRQHSVLRGAAMLLVSGHPACRDGERSYLGRRRD